MKVCSICGVTKPIGMFPKNGRFKDGATRYRSDCKECYNIGRKAGKKKTAKFINNTKHRTGEEGYSFEDWKAAFMFFRGTCAYCGRPQSRRVKLTKDHVVPVSKGGPTTRRNIIPACGLCNSSKTDRDWLKWYRSSETYCVDRERRIKQWKNA